MQVALKGKASLVEMNAELALKADRDDVEALRSQLERHLNAMVYMSIFVCLHLSIYLSVLYICA